MSTSLSNPIGRIGCWLGLWALLAGQAWASPHRLDDSQSQVVPPNVQMQWRSIAPGQGDTGMEAWVRVNARIATGAWLGRSVRVYMVLPRDQSATLEAEWTTQGRLLAGRLVTGERALVWAGVMASEMLEDQLLVRLRAASDWGASSRRLNFHFELDTD
jgi:hypothetical protein